MEEVDRRQVVILENVTKVIRNRTILEDVSLKISSSQIYGIGGPNGSGKSMLLRVISGLVYPTEGKVFVLVKKLEET